MENQNQVENPKAAKRKHMKNLEANINELKTHANAVRYMLDAQEKRGKEPALKLIANSDAICLLPPDFMSVKTYMKLYINECDEALNRMEKELDDLT